HHFATDAGKYVIDIVVEQLRLERQPLVQQLPQRRDVPLSVAEREEDLADGLFGGDAKRLKKCAVCLRDAELGVEHEQRLAHGVENVEQQLLCERNLSGRSLIGGPFKCPAGFSCLAIRHDAS